MATMAMVRKHDDCGEGDAATHGTQVAWISTDLAKGSYMQQRAQQRIHTALKTAEKLLMTAPPQVRNGCS